MAEQSASKSFPKIVLMCHRAIGCALCEEGSCPIQIKTYEAILDNEICCEGLWIPARFKSAVKKKGTEHVDRKAAAKAYLKEYGLYV